MVVTNRDVLVQARILVGAIQADGKRVGTNPVATAAPANPSCQRLTSPGFRGYSPQPCARTPDLLDWMDGSTRRAGRSGSRLKVLVHASCCSAAPLAWSEWTGTQREAERGRFPILSHSRLAPGAAGRGRAWASAALRRGS